MISIDPVGTKLTVLLFAEQKKIFIFNYQFLKVNKSVGQDSYCTFSLSGFLRGNIEWNIELDKFCDETCPPRELHPFNIVLKK